jgi:predicted component of type VI protein secretion system
MQIKVHYIIEGKKYYMVTKVDSSSQINRVVEQIKDRKKLETDKNNVWYEVMEDIKPKEA